MMEEDPELEEGEAYDGASVDVDAEYSYLDEKLATLLGDCQKEFEGPLFSDRLGSKFGGYGTFLPTHARVPSALPSSVPASDSLKARSSEVHADRMRRIAAGSVSADRGLKVSPNEMGAKGRGSSNGIIHSSEAASNTPVKTAMFKDAVPADQKKTSSFTVRLTLPKQHLNKDAQKAMYNGFGLDDSGDDEDEDQEDGSNLSLSDSSSDLSPCTVIRVMTSHRLPAGGLLSPSLDIVPEPHEREMFTKAVKKSGIVTGQKSDAGEVTVTVRNDVEVGRLGNVVDGNAGNAAKDRKEKGVEKVKERERKEIAQSLDPVVKVRKEPDIEKRSVKEGSLNNLKISYKLSKENQHDFELKAGRIGKEGVLGSSEGLRKEGDNVKEFVQKSRKEKVLRGDGLKEEVKIKDVVGDLREGSKEKGESSRDSKKVKEIILDPPMKDNPTKDTSKVKHGGKARKEDSGKEFMKQSWKEEETKKLGSGDLGAGRKEILKEALVEPKKKVKEVVEGPHVSKEASKELAKDTIKDARRETKKESQKKEVLCQDTGEFGRDVPKDAIKFHGMEALNKKNGKELASGVTLPPAQSLLPMPPGPSNAEPIASIVPMGNLVLDNWVQCDKCAQWRLLLPGMNPKDLPLTWHCKMITWLPNMNHCKYTEDMTTAAVYDLLGFQNPLLQPNPALQVQQGQLLPSIPASVEPVTEDRIPETKVVKGHKSATGVVRSKGGSVPLKPLNVSRKKLEAGAVKNKSLNDVAQNLVDRVPDKSTPDAFNNEDLGYTRVMAEKPKGKEREKTKRVGVNEGAPSWRDEARMSCDGGERADDMTVDVKRDARHRLADDIKDERVEQQEMKQGQSLQKDGLLHRSEKNDAPFSKDLKLGSASQALPAGQLSGSWEGDRVLVPCSGRKDAEAVSSRIVDSQNLATTANGRSRADVQQVGAASSRNRGKSSQVDGVPLDVRIVDSGKKAKDHKKGFDDDGSGRSGGVLKILGPNTHGLRGGEGLSGSPSKKEHAQVAAAMREAKDLKHSADRLTAIPGMENESTNIYLQAALKFMQAASMMEAGIAESSMQGDLSQYMSVYLDTAKLCEFCAAIYDRHKALEAAALAQICAAVVRMRLVQAKSHCFSKDCTELHNAALAAVHTPPSGLLTQPHSVRTSDKRGSSHGPVPVTGNGESPSSSSASDLNNQTVASDKVLSLHAAKPNSSSPIPTTAVNDLLPARLQPNYQRLLRNGMEISLMLESWSKSSIAIAAAEVACAGDQARMEGMLAVKKVGEVFMLGEVESVVRLVRLAMDAIGH